MPDILHSLQDSTVPEDCLVFYRPSFGRRGGEGRAEFGEFDFILATKKNIYLGESKWDKSSQAKQPLFELAPEQRLRHAVLQRYIKEWFDRKPNSWAEFVEECGNSFELGEVIKTLAPKGTLLSENLLTVLRIIKEHFGTLPEIRNVLLYLYNANRGNGTPNKELKDFDVIPINYARDLSDNFIEIEL
jgi:hypothetical protein